MFTTPELILRTFEQYCEYRRTPQSMILSPQLIGRWIVVFCDLPATDKYGIQRVISFLRQLIGQVVTGELLIKHGLSLNIYNLLVLVILQLILIVYH